MSAKNDGRASPTSSASTRCTYGPGREEFEVLQAYNSLIKAGGRPVCPLGETTRISKDPGRYSTILSPWVKDPLASSIIDWKDIFQQQLCNWQRFRAWQQSNRDVEMFMPDVPAHDAAEDGNPSPSSSDYSSRSTKLDVHVARAKRRLSSCGFTKSFTFNNDLGRQDEWTTWIEYLSFECYCCDFRSQRLQSVGLDDLHSAMILGHFAAQANKGHANDLPGSSYNPDSTLMSDHVRNNDDHGILPTEDLDTRNLTWKHTYSLDEDDTLKDARIGGENEGTCVEGGAVNRTHDGNGRSNREIRDTEHHNLILRWALLQEPKIAAQFIHCQPATSVDGEPLREIQVPRLKRNRDGSLCNTNPVHFQNGILEEANDNDVGLEHKRSRNSG